MPILLTPSTIYVSAVTNEMNDDGLRITENLVHDPVVADPKLVQTGQVACKGLGLDIVQVCSQPANAPDNTATNGPVQTGQLT